jgi:predicted nucleic acid-binding protein
VDRTAIVNASPLIFLSRGQQTDILRHFANRILIPEPVAEEIRRKGISDITSQVLESTPWIEVVPAPTAPESILEWGLGSGESAVLAMAYGNPEREAIIDDLAGRK